MSDSPAAPKKLSVLMPVYNERATLETIVERVLQAPIDLELELIIVDDGSKDGSGAVMDRLAESDPRIKVFHQPANQGKGAAVRKAIELASGDFGLIQDADLEYDPADYPALLKPLCDGRADVVYGSRFTGPEARIHLFWHQLANNWLTTMSNMLNNLNLTDMETGYKVFRMDLLKQIPIHSSSFGIEPEVTAKIARVGARIYEVPIRYHGRSYWEGKKITWKDGVVAVYAMLKYALFDPNFTRDSTLLRLQQRARDIVFNTRLMARLRGYIGQRVLEAGSGLGTFSRFVLDSERLILAERDPFLCDMLRHNFGSMAHVRVQELALDDEDAYRPLQADQLDTVLCAYALEDMSQPTAALRGFHHALQPGGRAVIVLSPGESGWTQQNLHAGLRAAGFEVELVTDYAKLNVPGWLGGPKAWNGLMKRFPGWLSRGEAVLPWKGQLVIGVGRKV